MCAVRREKHVCEVQSRNFPCCWSNHSRRGVPASFYSRQDQDDPIDEPLR